MGGAEMPISPQLLWPPPPIAYPPIRWATQWQVEVVEAGWSGVFNVGARQNGIGIIIKLLSYH